MYLPELELSKLKKSLWLPTTPSLTMRAGLKLVYYIRESNTKRLLDSFKLWSTQPENQSVFPKWGQAAPPAAPGNQRCPESTKRGMEGSFLCFQCKTWQQFFSRNNVWCLCNLRLWKLFSMHYIKPVYLSRYYWAWPNKKPQGLTFETGGNWQSWKMKPMWEWHKL